MEKKSYFWYPLGIVGVMGALYLMYSLTSESPTEIGFGDNFEFNNDL